MAPSQDVDEALKRLPQEAVDARNQRLKRAIDISMKHSELPKELQAVQTPFEFYMKASGAACASCAAYAAGVVLLREVGSCAPPARPRLSLA